MLLNCRVINVLNKSEKFHADNSHFINYKIQNITNTKLNWPYSGSIYFTKSIQMCFFYYLTACLPDLNCLTCTTASNVCSECDVTGPPRRFKRDTDNRCVIQQECDPSESLYWDANAGAEGCNCKYMYINTHTHTPTPTHPHPLSSTPTH